MGDLPQPLFHTTNMRKGKTMYGWKGDGRRYAGRINETNKSYTTKGILLGTGCYRNGKGGGKGDLLHIHIIRHQLLPSIPFRHHQISLFRKTFHSCFVDKQATIDKSKQEPKPATRKRERESDNSATDTSRYHTFPLSALSLSLL